MPENERHLRLLFRNLDRHTHCAGAMFPRVREPADGARCQDGRVARRTSTAGRSSRRPRASLGASSKAQQSILTPNKRLPAAQRAPASPWGWYTAAVPGPATNDEPLCIDSTRPDRSTFTRYPLHSDPQWIATSEPTMTSATTTGPHTPTHWVTEMCGSWQQREPKLPIPAALVQTAVSRASIALSTVTSSPPCFLVITLTPDKLTANPLLFLPPRPRQSTHSEFPRSGTSPRVKRPQECAMRPFQMVRHGRCDVPCWRLSAGAVMLDSWQRFM